MDVTRLKKLRLARGMSLEALATEMGGLVTKQSLSKYERNASKPSLVVAEKLARVLGVKTIDLWAEPEFLIRYIAFRKGSRLTKGETSRLSSCCDLEIERRIHLQQLLWSDQKPDLSPSKFKVHEIEKAEAAAEELRVQWKLGNSPIANLTNTLESRLVHVVELEGDKTFDGWSAEVVHGSELVGTAVISRKGLMRGRQRLNLAHELGHLVCDPIGVDEEKVAFRFAGAFLAPKETLLQDVGHKRTSIAAEELRILSRKYGMSMQAMLRRLSDLQVINDAYYTSWCKFISKQGWRKKEPGEVEPESSFWVNQVASRALAEGLITPEEAEKATGRSFIDQTSNSLKSKRSFLELPLSERHRLLEEQAEKLSEHYSVTADDDTDGEFYEYAD